VHDDASWRRYMAAALGGSAGVQYRSGRDFLVLDCSNPSHPTRDQRSPVIRRGFTRTAPSRPVPFSNSSSMVITSKFKRHLHYLIGALIFINPLTWGVKFYICRPFLFDRPKSPWDIQLSTLIPWLKRFVPRENKNQK
jgi:hypothetical protein